MKKGFTLIEVCLVMLVFGIAVSSIMAFFPVSLRQANTTVSDSIVTTIADYVINSLQANAAKMTDWQDWQVTKDKDGNNKETFRQNIVKDIRLDTSGGGVDLDYKDTQEISGYLGMENSYLKYQLDFRPSNDNRLWQIVLYVTDNKHISLSQAQTFGTHVVYLGEAPE